MVIGKPWEDPQRRPEYVVDLNTGTGGAPDDEAPVGHRKSVV